jgi:sirohydrochlorin cobaltochelatase
MARTIEQLLAAALANGGCNIGQIALRKDFVLTHVDDVDLARSEIFRSAEDAIALAKFDDAGNYRPLKTAPNLRHGWRMELVDLRELVRALDYFYPARLSILREWNEDRLKTTPLRATLDRQSGMYRVAANISDEQIDDVVANVCRTDGGCLRRILWRRDSAAAIPSTSLPQDKYEVPDEPLPLLCQEACTVLINACRKAVKGE